MKSYTLEEIGQQMKAMQRKCEQCSKMEILYCFPQIRLKGSSLDSDSQKPVWSLSGAYRNDLGDFTFDGKTPEEVVAKFEGANKEPPWIKKAEQLEEQARALRAKAGA